MARDVERRRSPRLSFHRPLAGEISLLQDVAIEEIGESDVTLIAAMPVARGEQLLLHLEAAEGRLDTLVVQELERRIVMAEGQLRQRLRVKVVRSEGGESE